MADFVEDLSDQSAGIRDLVQVIVGGDEDRSRRREECLRVRAAADPIAAIHDVCCTIGGNRRRR